MICAHDSLGGGELHCFLLGFILSYNPSGLSQHDGPFCWSVNGHPKSQQWAGRG